MGVDCTAQKEIKQADRVNSPVYFLLIFKNAADSTFDTLFRLVEIFAFWNFGFILTTVIGQMGNLSNSKTVDLMCVFFE